MSERTLEEKYELAKRVLMIIERVTLAQCVGQFGEEEAMPNMRAIANMAHVANHVNEEPTFDCGPQANEHHAMAMEEYDRMYEALLEDITQGIDISQILNKGAMQSKKYTPPDMEFDNVPVL